MQGRKLYVGGLSFNSSEQGLRDYLGANGNVDTVKIITDHETGRSKGFAFVEMGSPSEAEAVIAAYDGKDFEGRRLNISEARPQAPRSNGGGRGGW